MQYGLTMAVETPATAPLGPPGTAEPESPKMSPLVAEASDPFDDFDEDDFDDDFDDDFEEDWEDDLTEDDEFPDTFGGKDDGEEESEDSPFSDDPNFDD